ncbi:MAG TPA: archaetidylinositol phosphate synthase [Methanobacterium sp.]|jgi:archaetidylinositol phosphate synthase|nr:MAG: CDP-alcohol phosphatidyltransferase family protein [Methanobacterium sp.]HOI70659.1 archaetidylinositol phosphate synthase [Methanobacterium sp.]HPX78182.1 archaetidylinositol phosphate synthase [Methanobacterium sp.]
MLNKLRPFIEMILDPIASRMRINPNIITIAGLLMSVVAAYMFARGDLLLGGVFIALSGFVDMLDGVIARKNRSTTPFGGVLDSTMDRFSDAIIFIGIIAGGFIDWFIGILTILASFTVSYVRARAESEGIRCNVGIAERPERLLILIAGAFIGYFYDPFVMYLAVILVMMLGYLTVIQRLYHSWRELKQRKRKL